MQFVINGVKYEGVKGDDYKTAAKDLIARGEPIDPYHSYVDDRTKREIQRELDKHKYVTHSLW